MKQDERRETPQQFASYCKYSTVSPGMQFLSILVIRIRTNQHIYSKSFQRKIHFWTNMYFNLEYKFTNLLKKTKKEAPFTYNK